MTPDTPGISASTARVELKNLTVRFGTFTALQDLNFTAGCGADKAEFITIIGPSGCGKSTMLNVLAGLLGPTEGQALVDGQEIEGTSGERGMIFQQYSSFPNLTVLGNVRFGLDLNSWQLDMDKRQRTEKAMEMIRQVGLLGHENKYPHQLSGGQQQRVAIARTLSLEPKILLMDEPFSALDEPTRLEMQELVVNLWFRIKPIIFCVTHSITEAVYLGSRVLIFTHAPGQIAYDICEAIPPTMGVPPLVAQEKGDFKDAVRVVTDAFRNVSQQKLEGMTAPAGAAQAPATTATPAATATKAAASSASPQQGSVANTTGTSAGNPIKK